jgi:GxxExxY protein
MAAGPTKLDADTERVAAGIVDASFQVHAALGPGLLESAYEKCLAHALTLRGHAVESQIALPIDFLGLRIEAAYRVDLLVDAKVIVEVKAVETLQPVHRAQLMTYLRVSKLRLGFLINFNVPVIRAGLNRMIV